MWQSTIRHIALESRYYVIACDQYVEKRNYLRDLFGYGELEQQPEIMCPGGSAIVDLLGQYVKEPVYIREEIIVADLYLDLITQSRLDFNVMGHYARPDVF